MKLCVWNIKQKVYQNVLIEAKELPHQTSKRKRRRVGGKYHFSFIDQSIYYEMIHHLHRR